MKYPDRQSNTSRPNQRIVSDFLVYQPDNSQLTQLPVATNDNLQKRLILTLDGKVIREYLIENLDISIGRNRDNDIQLNDQALSGQHALITCMPDYIFIEDLGSTNGTLVNGSHIKKVTLEHGDIIQIGHHQLTYLSENFISYEPTMFIKAEHDETQFIFSEADETVNIIKGLPLGALYSSSKGNQPPMPVMELRKTCSTIGFKGKRMALITRGKECYTIKAIPGAYNRRAIDIPLLNGDAVRDEHKILNPGDIITVAGFDMSFYYID